eukprot:GGOE01065233.1.p2 GENE.GGOE01065233.1~~GGOE01065233.1.p2  ORF type:complete len:107 (+),score=9.77 GGOE01065233.1:222-542(+)
MQITEMKRLERALLELPSMLAFGWLPSSLSQLGTGSGDSGVTEQPVKDCFFCRQPSICFVSQSVERELQTIPRDPHNFTVLPSVPQTHPITHHFPGPVAEPCGGKL